MVLVLGNEHRANFWHASLEVVWDSWLCLFLVAFLCLSPPTGPICPFPGLIVNVLLGRGCVCHLCLLDHFPECCLWAFLGGGPTSSYFSARWELCTLGSVLIFFSSCLIGVPIWVLVLGFFWSGFWSGYLSQIFVNDLPSRYLLLYLKIVLETSLFWLLPSNIKSLGTMTSRKYGQSDVYISDTMVSSKIYWSRYHPKRYEHNSICL